MRTGASNDTVTTLIPDWQGTTHHQVTNATGDLKTTWQDPYGNTRGVPPTGWTAVPNKGPAPNPVAAFFTGMGSGIWDTAAGLLTAAGDAITDPVGIRRAQQMYATIEASGIDGTASAIWEGITQPYTSRWNSGDQAGAIGYGVSEIVLAVVGTKGVTKAGKLGATVTSTTERTVAIGRNMSQRVVLYAEKNGFDWYKGTPKWIPRGTIEKASPRALEKTDLWFNRRWIKGEVRNGSRIVDIGEPAGYPPSSFYSMDREQVAGYWNYTQDIQP